jgi:2',3'-cyclic-nucleotide 2'-phosphodiesterase/3'-nucleotidase
VPHLPKSSALSPSFPMFSSSFSLSAKRRSRAALCALAAFPLLAGAAPGDRTRVTILATTDLHGNILPLDYFTNRPANVGLAKAATLIQQARKDDPNLVLIDSGDTIQGTPLAYYHNRKNNTPPDPMMLAMSALRFDAMAIGNHEYNFGLGVLEKARREAAFPWLSGNTYRVGTEETAYAPYLVKEVNGARVGIVGLTTPGVPSWENPDNVAGLEFRDPIAAARKWVAHLRTNEGVDVVVVAMHMGLEADLRTGRTQPGQVPMENAALAIATRVPGVDVIAMGHTHREVPALFVNGALLAQAGRWGDCVMRADVFLEKDAQDRWQIVSKGSRTIPVTESTPADPAILALAEPYERETQAWLGKVIGKSAVELTARDATFRDNALLDLIHRVQLAAGKADVSFAASFNPRARIGAGPVTVRDIAALYIYENTLVVVAATGAQIKAALEHSARYFRDYEAGKSPAELVDEKIPGYNFDIAEGVSYALDLRRPAGDRITDLRFQGQPLASTQTLHVAINNYRLNGGGGYTMFKDCPVVSRSSTEIRDLIIDWVERGGQIPATASGNWRLLPE